MSKPCYIMACYTTIQPPKLSCSSHTKMRGLRSKSISVSLKNFKTIVNPEDLTTDPFADNFRAAPDCRQHLECNDPIFRCFSLARVAKDLAGSSAEYREEYTKIAEETQGFAKDLLSMCKNTSEVDLILSETAGTTHFLRNSDKMKYPRLRLAVEINQKEFVGHMYCQQILTQEWVGTTSWDNHSVFTKILHVILQIIFTPVFALGNIFKSFVKDIDDFLGLKSVFVEKMETYEFFNNLESPLHRCISYFASLLVLMFLLVEAVVSPMAIDHYSNLNPDDIIRLQPHHYALMFMMIAFVFREVEDLMSIRSIWIYFNFDFWRIYRIINQWLIIIALVCQVHLDYQLHHEFETLDCHRNGTLTCTLADIHLPDYESELMITNSLYSIAATISTVHLFYWMQLHDKIGPIVISARHVLTDVFTVSSMYLIILIAFSSGIVFILGTKKVMEAFHNRQLWNENNESLLEDDYFYNFKKTVETLFWHSLGPGESTMALRESILAKVLMGFYQTISAVIFMNLLVAVMNATVQKIEDKKQLYWKFSRAGVWIRFFDQARALPPPFNIFNVFRYLWLLPFQIFSRNKVNKEDDFVATSAIAKKVKQQVEHKAVMLSLIQRYQDGQIKIEEENGHCQIREMKEEILAELSNLK